MFGGLTFGILGYIIPLFGKWLIYLQLLMASSSDVKCMYIKSCGTWNCSFTTGENDLITANGCFLSYFRAQLGAWQPVL